MAGSIKWMIYRDDADNPYCVRIDESNGEACGFEDVTTTNQNTPLLPKLAKMRYVNVVAAGASGEDIRRKLYVGTTAAYQGLVTSRVVTIDGVGYNVRSFRGEKFAFPIPIDTGITDGDIT